MGADNGRGVSVVVGEAWGGNAVCFFFFFLSLFYFPFLSFLFFSFPFLSFPSSIVPFHSFPSFSYFFSRKLSQKAAEVETTEVKEVDKDPKKIGRTVPDEASLEQRLDVIDHNIQSLKQMMENMEENKEKSQALLGEIVNDLKKGLVYTYIYIYIYIYI